MRVERPQVDCRQEGLVQALDANDPAAPGYNKPSVYRVFNLRTFSQLTEFQHPLNDCRHRVTDRSRQAQVVGPACAAHLKLSSLVA